MTEESDAGSAGRQRLRMAIWILVLAALLGLAAAWIWTPLRGAVDVPAATEWLDRFRREPWAPLVLVAGFVVGGMLVLPITLMVVLSVTVFGPLWGFGYALLGGITSAMVSFGLGHWLGRRTVERLAGGRIHRVSEKLGQHGILSVSLLRLVPIAHFTVISLWAGASHIRARDFLAGTTIGMLPGTLAVTLFVDRAVAVARRPDPMQFMYLALIALAVATALTLTWLWARRHNLP